jgi:hypothetical protein
MARYEASFPVEAEFSPCSEELLQDVSRALARPLPFPEDYLDFLRQWNGAAFYDGIIVPHKQGRDKYSLSKLEALYGIGDPDGPCDLRTEGKGYAFEQRVPSHMLAIGEDDHWNRACMSLGKETYGRVYMWRPGEPWEPDGIDVPTEEWLRPVADSFEEFWSVLRTEEQYWKDQEGRDDEWEIELGAP